MIFFQYPTTTLPPPYDTARKKEPPLATSASQFASERDACLAYFERWSETDQVGFVESLLARMCHYQHGHIDAYLKPILQRDFISLLPSKSSIELIGYGY